MTDHHRSHESLTWGPHMHACWLYHWLQPSQSTSTISSGHRSTIARARTACPTTLASAACKWALPTQTALADTRTHVHET
jgi:hypothetical protein